MINSESSAAENISSVALCKALEEFVVLHYEQKVKYYINALEDAGYPEIKIRALACLKQDVRSL